MKASKLYGWTAASDDAGGSGTTSMRVRAREYMETTAPRDETIPARLEGITTESYGSQQADGSWTGDLILPSNASDGTYGVYVTLYDEAGNAASYYSDALDAIGGSSFIIGHNNADNEHPTLESLTITPSGSSGQVTADVSWQGQ